jgi:predicted ATPase
LIPDAPSGRFQMLQTTRAYAINRLKESGDLNEVAARHAKFFAHLLSHLNEEAAILSISDAFATYSEHLGNVRAALEWSFSRDGDSDLAVSLASHSGRLFIEMSLLPECRAWMTRAVEHLTKVQTNARQEMQICAALGVSSMFTLGGTPEAGQAFERALELALELGDRSYALGLLAMLNIFRLRIGDNQGALEVALRGEIIARDLHDPAAVLVSKWTLGVSYYQLGDFDLAQSNCETALLPQSDSSRRGAVRFLGYDHRVRALVVETISLWLRGYPVRAVRTAQIAMQEAERAGQSIPICVAYLCACTVFLWAKDFPSAEAVIEQTIVYAKKHSLLPFHAAGIGFRGSIYISKGNVELGIPMVEECLATLYREKYLVMAVGFAARLAKGLARIHHFETARETIETAIELNSSQGDITYKAHLARVRGEIIASQPNPNFQEAEHHLLTAIDWSQRQSALSVELRAATALGHLWVCKGRLAEAHALVGRVYHLFTEGFEMPDLRNAKELLDRLGANVDIPQQAGGRNRF